MKQLTDAERLEIAVGLLGKYELDEYERICLEHEQNCEHRRYIVYIPYSSYTEHTIEADSPEQARKIAFDMGNLDRELLDNLEVQDEYVGIKEII